MKVTYNWLKDFVEIRIPPGKLAEKLTMAGLEVVGLEERGGDFIFEIEITSNRPDWLSVVGIAREVAAITGKKFKTTPATKPGGFAMHYGERQRPPQNLAGSPCIMAKDNETTIKINIEDKKDCPLYTAKVIKDVKISQSPAWIKERLELIGCRSINNVVDITNYLLFELGEPLHAFDLDKLTSPDYIGVRRGRAGEKITTIDGQERLLDKDILVITDKRTAVAIAGVMGGEDTEVVGSTHHVLLEAAIFNPALVRSGRQKLGIQSESSYRFERNVDPEIVEYASWRAAKLIEETSGGKIILESVSAKTKIKKPVIVLSESSIERILGVQVPSAAAGNMLSSLGFSVKKRPKRILSVGVPSYRQDVSGEIDLIEEVARIFGYDKIPTSLAKASPCPSLGGEKLPALMRNILVGLGLNEAITYSLVDRDSVRHFGFDDASCPQLVNPLSKEQEILRPSVIPGLVRCVAYNLNQKQEPVAIFEIAKGFKGYLSAPKEEPVLGIALCGIKKVFLQDEVRESRLGLRHAKGILEELFSRLGINNVSYSSSANGKHVVLVSGENAGIIMRLGKEALDYADIKNRDVVAAEIYIDKISPFVNLRKKFTPAPKYPHLTRDISLVLKDDTNFNSLLSALKEEGKPFLKEIEIIDYYKGQQIPAGYIGLTLACRYRLDERTLTEAEINPVHSRVCAVLTGQFGAKIR